MTTFARCCFLLMLGLASFVGNAQAVRPVLIRTDDGATLVFNTMESFFALDVVGDDVKPAPNNEGYFQVDARLIRIFNTPTKELTKTAGKQVLMPKELLQMQYRRDLEEEQFKLQRTFSNPHQEELTTPKGRVVLHWWIDLPAVAGGPTQRHYMSTICDRHALTVCTSVLPGDTPAAVRQYLLTVMTSVRESDEPINIAEYAKELKGEK